MMVFISMYDSDRSRCLYLSRVFSSHLWVLQLPLLAEGGEYRIGQYDR